MNLLYENSRPMSTTILLKVFWFTFRHLLTWMEKQESLTVILLFQFVYHPLHLHEYRHIHTHAQCVFSTVFGIPQVIQISRFPGYKVFFSVIRYFHNHVQCISLFCQGRRLP